MKPISIFEHQPIASLTSAKKNLLDQLRGPHNEQVFDVGWRETRATSFVGVVQLPQTTLQVLPKMYRHEDVKEREATAPTAGDATGSISPTTNSPRTTSPTGSSRPPSIASPAGHNGPTPAGA